jgi:hypothetical protein
MHPYFVCSIHGCLTGGSALCDLPRKGYPLVDIEENPTSLVTSHKDKETEQSNGVY